MYASEPDPPSDDEAVVATKEELGAFFDDNPDGVYYERQIQVRFEERHFQWVTRRALHELQQDGRLSSEVIPLGVVKEGEEGTSEFASLYRCWGI